MKFNLTLKVVLIIACFLLMQKWKQNMDIIAQMMILIKRLFEHKDHSFLTLDTDEEWTSPCKSVISYHGFSQHFIFYKGAPSKRNHGIIPHIILVGSKWRSPLRSLPLRWSDHHGNSAIIHMTSFWMEQGL